MEGMSEGLTEVERGCGLRVEEVERGWGLRVEEVAGGCWLGVEEGVVGYVQSPGTIKKTA